MGQKCRACGRFASATEGAKCAVLFHRACVNIPKDARISTCWQCPECKVLTPRKDNTEDPVRGEEANFDSLSKNPASALDVSAEILREVRLHRAETKSLREGFEALRTVVEVFDTRLGDLEARLAVLEIKVSDSQIVSDHGSNEQVEILRSSVEKLKGELNDRDQEAFSNDLEITGIPEEQGENVGRLVNLITIKLGVACEERDIVFAERVGMKRAPSSGLGANDHSTTARPRPLVLRVTRRQLRDNLLQAARVRRGLTTDGMGLAAAPAKFYLNERLSRFNKMLFYQTRERARARGWKHIWTRGGRIFVRRETGKASFRVRSEPDLEKIFGGDGISV